MASNPNNNVNQGNNVNLRRRWWWLNKIKVAKQVQVDKRSEVCVGKREIMCVCVCVLEREMCVCEWALEGRWKSSQSEWNVYLMTVVVEISSSHIPPLSPSIIQIHHSICLCHSLSLFNTPTHFKDISSSLFHYLLSTHTTLSFPFSLSIFLSHKHIKQCVSITLSLLHTKKLISLSFTPSPFLSLSLSHTLFLSPFYHLSLLLSISHKN